MRELGGEGILAFGRDRQHTFIAGAGAVDLVGSRVVAVGADRRGERAQYLGRRRIGVRRGVEVCPAGVAARGAENLAGPRAGHAQVEARAGGGEDDVARGVDACSQLPGERRVCSDGRVEVRDDLRRIGSGAETQALRGERAEDDVEICRAREAGRGVAAGDLGGPVQRDGVNLPGVCHSRRCEPKRLRPGRGVRIGASRGAAHTVGNRHAVRIGNGQRRAAAGRRVRVAGGRLVVDRVLQRFCHAGQRRGVGGSRTGRACCPCRTRDIGRNVGRGSACVDAHRIGLTRLVGAGQGQVGAGPLDLGTVVLHLGAADRAGAAAAAADGNGEIVVRAAIGDAHRLTVLDGRIAGGCGLGGINLGDQACGHVGEVGGGCREGICRRHTTLILERQRPDVTAGHRAAKADIRLLVKDDAVGLHRDAADGAAATAVAAKAYGEIMVGAAVGDAHHLAVLRRRVAGRDGFGGIHQGHEARGDIGEAGGSCCKRVGGRHTALILERERPHVADGHRPAKADIGLLVGRTHYRIRDPGDTVGGFAAFLDRDGEGRAAGGDQVDRVGQSHMRGRDARGPHRGNRGRQSRRHGIEAGRGRGKAVVLPVYRHGPHIAHGDGAREHEVGAGERQHAAAMHRAFAQHHGRIFKAMAQAEPEAVGVAELDGRRIGGRDGSRVGCPGGDVIAVGGCPAGDLADKARGNVRQAGARRPRFRGYVCGAHRIGVVQAVEGQGPDVARLHPARQLDVGARVIGMARRFRLRGSGRSARLRQHGRGDCERVAVGAAVAGAADLHVRRTRLDIDAIADLRIEECVPVAGRIHALDFVAELEDRLRFEDEVRGLVAFHGNVQVVVHPVRQAV